MKFQITKTFSFEAAHQLKYHDGKCKGLHGHSYKLTVYFIQPNLQPKRTVEDGEINPEHNMVLDFTNISKVVKPFIDKFLDHKFLNETIVTDSPTAEVIAEFCFLHLKNEFLQKHQITLHGVEINETKDTSVFVTG